ncbi:hypothetical protein pdam_00017447 [Pocillopora damicornis]|uniref:Uncharacterized protein n=1 Tax=Pocillopora damicornis TaxID=46731 RepID=A0A3M6U789_POCDA|nr:hypothetical protein pdam_00017447 [Pocillopora damicornis]
MHTDGSGTRLLADVIVSYFPQFLCVLPCRHFLVGFNSDEFDELCVTPRIFVFLLNVCKFFVWQSQTDFRSRNVRPGAADIIIMKVMMTRLRFHLPIFFKHFKSLRRHRYFHHQWGARGAATFTNDHLSKLLTFLPCLLLAS